MEFKEFVTHYVVISYKACSMARKANLDAFL